MLTTLVGLLALSLLTRETSLFLLSLALLVAALLSRLWERYCLTRVEYRRRFSRSRIPFGEEVQMEIEVVNRKLLPLSWLEVEEELPQGLPAKRGRMRPSFKPGRALLGLLFALRPYERVRRRYSIPCLVRGEHLVGPVRLRSGDLFGFVTVERTMETVDSFVVYPRVVPLTHLGLPARHPLGELRSQSWIFEDVSRIAGARDYRPADGLRRVHWPASAKAQRLQARVYEPTTSHKLMVFLNLATGGELVWEYGYDPDLLELGITTAASISRWGLDQGYQVGLHTNGRHREGRGNVSVEAGRDSVQLERILLALARLEPLQAQRFDSLLAEETRRLPFGVTLVVVTADLTPAVVASLRGLRRHGHAVSVLLTGRQGAGVSPEGITLRRVGPPEAWRDAAVLPVMA